MPFTRLCLFPPLPSVTTLPPDVLQELVFVEDMIHRDVRNNSAWAQRSLLLRHAASAAAAASTLTHTTAAPHSTAPLHPATRSSAKAPAEPSAGIASLSMEVTVEGPGTSQGTPPDEQLSPAAAARGSPSAADADMSDSPEPFSVTAARGGWPALLDRELQYLAVKVNHRSSTVLPEHADLLPSSRCCKVCLTLKLVCT